MYDIKNGVPTAEIKEYKWDKRITRQEHDFKNNTVSEQKMKIVKENYSEYELVSYENELFFIICLFSYPPFSGIRTETGKRDETEYSVYLCGRSSAGIGRIWLFGENT